MTSPETSPPTAEASGTVITIDGPAGAGKSSVAKRLADRLGFYFLDTGAMYRCVTLAVLRSGVSVTDARRIEQIAKNAKIELVGSRVLLGGDDVSDEIRTPKVATAIGLVADNISVRNTLTELQRNWTRGKCVVSEGRDQGSEVFPDSPCKIFLLASPAERARRRQKELSERGIEMTYEDVLAQQMKRDEEDYSRPLGALRKADDALEICTDGLSLADVVERIAELVAARVDCRAQRRTTAPPPMGRRVNSPAGGTAKPASSAPADNREAGA